MNIMKARTKILISGLLLSVSVQGYSASEELYYSIGGAVPFSVSAGTGYQPSFASLGVGWNMSSSCSGFDIGATVSNQLNGLTTGFQDMMGSIINSATGAVAALPGMIIQRVNPGLYDMLQNGVLQGRVDFENAKLSCQSIATAAADYAESGSWMQRASSEAWESTAESESDAVRAQQEAEDQRGNQGITSIGGLKKGGEGQSPLKIISDVVYAGFNQLHGRSNSADESDIEGGGDGWGSVLTGVGDWAGAAMKPSVSVTSNCKGGMCTLWKNPEEAAMWVSDVLGEVSVRLCDGCDKVKAQAGTGLTKKLEEEFHDIASNLNSLLSDPSSINANSLQGVSAGESLVVNRKVIEAISADPDGSLLAQRLASEIAFARTITKAMWARRTLMAGMSDPNILEAGQYEEKALAKLELLNTEMQMLKEEMEIRTMLASNAATALLQRSNARASAAGQTNRIAPKAKLDALGAPR